MSSSSTSKADLPPAAAAAAAAASSARQKGDLNTGNGPKGVEQLPPPANTDDYDWKNKLLVVAACVFGIGTLFFGLLAGNVIPGLNPTMLGGIAASAALAFATAIAAIIAIALRCCPDEEASDPKKPKGTEDQSKDKNKSDKPERDPNAKPAADGALGASGGSGSGEQPNPNPGDKKTGGKN